VALKTTLEQLEEVQAAITAVMSGQDVSIDGKRLSRANLGELSKREDILLARYKAEQGTGGPVFNRGLLERD
jgi:predicted Abi (CAAX) family protease